MGHKLVKFTSGEFGDKRPPDDYWHYVQNVDAERSLCHGQVFGFGESDIEYKTKIAERGGITCPACLSMIKDFKSIKL